MDSNLLFKMKLKVEGQTKRFESLSYGFESFLGTKFEFYKGNSNPLHSDSNPLFVEALNARPATPTTRFSNSISLTTAS